MTAQDENNQQVEQDDRLERILQTVRSIDRNVEEILERLGEHFEQDKYDPAWNSSGCLNDNDY